VTRTPTPKPEKRPPRPKPEGEPRRARAPQPVLPREWTLLVLLSVVLFVTRTYAAKVVGFGDSEALYACYALHPAAAYLDHPGLVGDVARALGHGSAPRPETAHVFTSVIGALVPGLVAATTRIAGASLRAAAATGLVALTVPMLAVGLFALTPDLLLAPLWLLAIALGVFATREGKTTAGDVAWLFFGVVAGLATWAKASGSLLFLVAIVHHAKKEHRRPYAFYGAIAGLVVASPLVLFEARSGFAMLRHRLFETQVGLPPLVKGLGSLTVGQLLYLSPVFAALAFLGLREAYRKRSADDATTRFLALATLMPAVLLGIFSLASRQAEPHWMAPAWLCVPILFAHLERSHGLEEGAMGDGRTGYRPSPKLVSAGIAIATLFSVAVHAWVLSPRFLALAPSSYEPRYDIANELYGWPRALEAVRETAGPDDVVVGPHWIVCAQLHAGLPRTIRVGCNTPIRDDFDGWLPRATWKSAPRVIFVSDNRFDVTPESVLPGYAHVQERRVGIYRGGRPVRWFTISTMEYAAHADAR
jgi:hypothetical protein